MPVDELERVSIFWDFENCQPSCSVDACALIENILREAHKYGKITSFKAYIDLSLLSKNPKPIQFRSQLQASGVLLIDTPHNDKKEVADKVIIVDMLAFAMENPAPATVMLITGDADFAYAVSTLRQRKYHVVLVTPRTMTTIKIPASETIDWQTAILPQKPSLFKALPLPRTPLLIANNPTPCTKPGFDSRHAATSGLQLFKPSTPGPHFHRYCEEFLSQLSNQQTENTPSKRPLSELASDDSRPTKRQCKAPPFVDDTAQTPNSSVLVEIGVTAGRLSSIGSGSSSISPAAVERLEQPSSAGGLLPSIPGINLGVKKLPSFRKANHSASRTSTTSASELPKMSAPSLFSGLKANSSREPLLDKESIQTAQYKSPVSPGSQTTEIKPKMTFSPMVFVAPPPPINQEDQLNASSSPRSLAADFCTSAHNLTSTRRGIFCRDIPEELEPLAYALETLRLADKTCYDVDAIGSAVQRFAYKTGTNVLSIFQRAQVRRLRQYIELAVLAGVAVEAKGRWCCDQTHVYLHPKCHGRVAWVNYSTRKGHAY